MWVPIVQKTHISAGQWNQWNELNEQRQETMMFPIIHIYYIYVIINNKHMASYSFQLFSFLPVFPASAVADPRPANNDQERLCRVDSSP